MVNSNATEPRPSGSVLTLPDGRGSVAGFTLLEVLISLFILSFILLSFNGILLVTTRQTYENYYSATASHQMIAMIERLYALKNAEGLDEQINTWNTQNKQLLPQGIGTVTGSYPSYTITICWGKKDHCLTKNIKY